MHSIVEVVAEHRGGRTVLTRLRAGGHYALRETGTLDGMPVLHLVGTLAGPLGGDEVRIVLRVGPGARLAVRSAAATIVQPSRHEAASRIAIDAEVGEGGLLDLAPEPTVVCAGAELTADLRLAVEGGARAVVLEETVLGRSGEPGGGWTGRTAATRDGLPLLRHTLTSALLTGAPLGAATALPAAGVRAVVTHLDTAASTGEAATHGLAVAMPLARGGLLSTAIGTRLTAARDDLRVLRATRPSTSDVTPVAGHL